MFMIMLKRGILLCALCLAATTALHGTEIIEAEKLDQAQLKKAIEAASDDSVIEIQGVSKTKAQWRSDFLANPKLPDAVKLKEMANELQAKFDAAAKALQDKQDRDIAEQNSKTAKEFNALTSR
jgi:aspartate/methionine/tyrosine aminotransferase